MKKIFLLLLCAVTLGLISCETSNGTEPTIEYDPNGEADWTVCFMVNDTMIKYFDMAIVDSLNLSLDCSKLTVREVDTAQYVTDRSMVMLSPSLIGLVPYSSLRVVELPVRLKAGDHKFYLNCQRNATPIQVAEGTKFDVVILTCANYADNSHVVQSCALSSRGTILHGVKDPATNFVNGVSSLSRLYYTAVSFKVRK